MMSRKNKMKTRNKKQTVDPHARLFCKKTFLFEQHLVSRDSSNARTVLGLNLIKCAERIMPDQFNWQLKYLPLLSAKCDR